MYLKRSFVDHVEHGDLFLGNTVKIVGRELKLIDYPEDYMRRNGGFRHMWYACSFLVVDSFSRQ